MSIDIANCPFCGESTNHKSDCWFELRDIGASRATLAAAWNRRATPLAPTPAAAEGRTDLIDALRAARVQVANAANGYTTSSHETNLAKRTLEKVDSALAAPLPCQAAVGLSDTDRMDFVAKSGVRGSTYKGITSINVIVHEDDLLCGGARYAIDCMIERDCAATQPREPK